MHRMMSSDPSATKGITLTPGLVRRVWTFAHAYRTRVFGFLAIVVVSSFLGLVPPLVIKAIIDTADHLFVWETPAAPAPTRLF